MNSDPNLVLASGSIVETGDPFGPPDRSFKTSYIKPGELKEIEAFDIQMKKSRSTDEGSKLTVIGVIENLAGGRGFGAGGCLLYTSPRPRERQKYRMAESA